MEAHISQLKAYDKDIARFVLSGLTICVSQMCDIGYVSN